MRERWKCLSTSFLTCSEGGSVEEQELELEGEQGTSNETLTLERGQHLSAPVTLPRSPLGLEPRITRSRSRALAQNFPVSQKRNDEAEEAEANSKPQEELPKYEVARILVSVIIEGLLYYRAAWKGWGAPDYDFYAARGFKTCPDRLMSFHERNPSQPGPPKRLSVWKESFDNSGMAEDHDDDDVPVEK